MYISGRIGVNMDVFLSIYACAYECAGVLLYLYIFMYACVHEH